MQTQVNELVIEALADGVLVVDINGIVRSANPASRRLLAAGDAVRSAPFILATEAAWQPLAELMHRTFAEQSPQEADVSLNTRTATPGGCTCARGWPPRRTARMKACA
jgi:two-component system sensor histidine kinase PilS (NtrC family)